MKTFIIAFSLSLFTFVSAFSQELGQDHFLIEFEKFTPPIQDMVKAFEGRTAEPFLANDISGQEHYLPNYQGKKVILWFWSVENPKALDQIGAMTLLQEKNPNSLKIISFAQEKKAIVKEYLKQYPMAIDVIPNGELFGQMAYGADMGNPRMFVIDESGIIRKVIPEQAFTDNTNLLISLESIIKGI